MDYFLDSPMDGELMMDPEDDRMEGQIDEPNFDINLGIDPLNPNNQVVEKKEKTLVDAEYVDFHKLREDFVEPALRYRLLHMFEVCKNRRREIGAEIEKLINANNTDFEFYKKFLLLLKACRLYESDFFPNITQDVLVATERTVNLGIDKVLADMARAQEEGIKENIRIAMVNLFDAYFRAGRFSDATKMYSRHLRDFCDAPRIFIPMLLNQIKALMHSQEFNRVDGFINQGERAVQDCNEREMATKPDHRGYNRYEENPMKNSVQQLKSDSAKFAAVSGVLKMIRGNFEEAANKFVYIEYEYFDFPELLSANDIAFYGCFCALATFSRSDLLTRVLNNGNFRKFLEPVGRLLDLIQAFRQNSFVTFFELMEELRPELLLNPYIHEHQANLYSMIRQRAFIQYTSTFCVINIDTMATVFRSEINELINELVTLIEKGKLAAYIDPIGKKLFRVQEEPLVMQAKSLHVMQEELEERIQAILMRAALTANQVSLQRELHEDENVGPRAARRRANPFDEGDDEDFQPDDVDVINQTQQLSFQNFNRGFHRIISRLGVGNSRNNQDWPGNENASDAEMMDP